MKRWTVEGERWAAKARIAWARFAAPWKKAWVEIRWQETLPLRFRILTKAYQDQTQHVAKVKVDPETAQHAWTRDLETMSRQREELRAAHAANLGVEAHCKQLEARCRQLEEGKTLSGLSAAEVERLALLMMASGKLAAEAAKVVLYGWKTPDPANPRGRPGYADVENCLGRVSALTTVLIEAGDVRRGDVAAHARKTLERVGEKFAVSSS